MSSHHRRSRALVEWPVRWPWSLVVVAGTDGLFGQLGGDKGVRAFIDDLYELIQEDSRVKLFFSGSKVDSIKAVQGGRGRVKL